MTAPEVEGGGQRIEHAGAVGRHLTREAEPVSLGHLPRGRPVQVVARARAEDFVVRIEGALILCEGTGDYAVFGRTIKDLRTSVPTPSRDQ